MRYDCADIFSLVEMCSKSEKLSCFDFGVCTSQPLEALWNRSAEESAKAYFLTNLDKSLLCEFGAELGKTDVEGQLKHIELYKVQFTKQLAESEENIKQKAKLYKTMGFFVGASLALIMI
jgi:stage III sporulation protein AB